MKKTKVDMVETRAYIVRMINQKRAHIKREQERLMMLHRMWEECVNAVGTEVEK